MESTIIQTSNQENKGISEQKERGNQGEAPVSSTRKPQARQTTQEGRNNKKKKWKKPYYPSFRIPRIQKDTMETVFNMARALI
ncbi:hypothetical protein O181_132564 [Austropuccinia psidii MF-1]|uniref:Uncharacterized protein n=1 Tax=Austropuccinia psidii MF-1 TaxID=1389203 RepID=A0A9Q3QC66_9BASI|nr:hypothetical protein [Austropuccinia psidii MF-1]